VSAPTLYSIGEVAAILGVSPHTIRAWERRYGVVRPTRTPARQRRYRGEDVDLLRDVKRAIELKGLSLRLAFQAVTGNLESVDMVPYHRRPKRSDRRAPAGDAAMFRAISDAVPELILVIDKDGTIVDANVSVARTFGNTRQRFIGRKVADLVDPFDRPKATLLYRPDLRSAGAWELNMATRTGTRLYSFHTGRLYQGDRALLAMVGSEMYDATGDAAIHFDRAIEIPEAPSPARNGGTLSALESLIGQLPFGVGVVTIGFQPRVVYGNSRLLKTLGLPPAALTGRSLGELLPDPSVTKALREAVKTRRSRTLKGVDFRGGTTARKRSLNVAFRPMLSSHRRVTAVLLIVQDATPEADQGRHLELSAIADRLGDATTSAELAETMLGMLTSSLPGIDFIVELTRARSEPGAQPVLRWTPAWGTSEHQITGGPVGELMAQAAKTGTQKRRDIAEASSSHRVTAVPLLEGGHGGPRKLLGLVVWRSHTGDPVAHARSTVDLLTSLFASAAELLDIRGELAAKTAFVQSVAAATSLIRSAADRSGLGRRLLELLARARRADSALIGRAEGDELVIEATYSSTVAGASPGDRYPLRGHFVSQSLVTGEPTASSRFDTLVDLPQSARKALQPVKHALAVPLVLEGAVAGVIALFRTSNAPFTEEDVELVQAVSTAAMFVVRPIIEPAR
jgi:PAS domain S-box-containing protein